MDSDLNLDSYMGQRVSAVLDGTETVAEVVFIHDAIYATQFYIRLHQEMVRRWRVKMDAAA